MSRKCNRFPRRVLSSLLVFKHKRRHVHGSTYILSGRFVFPVLSAVCTFTLGWRNVSCDSPGLPPPPLFFNAVLCFAVVRFDEKIVRVRLYATYESLIRVQKKEKF